MGGEPAHGLEGNGTQRQLGELGYTHCVSRVAETIEQSYVRTPPSAHDQRVTLRAVDWASYVALRDRYESPSVRMTYLGGTLEIMAPSPLHESAKTRINRLLSLWALERDVPLQGFGSTTFRSEQVERGLEPDECYVLGAQLRDVPDLAIEVVVTSGGIDKLAVHAPLGIREVWFWKDEAFQIRVLEDGRYTPRDRSALLPSLDIEQLATFCREPDQHVALKAYRAALAG